MLQSVENTLYPPLDTASPFEEALADERARLVRLCACLTGNADAAEDLAQETLLEAWRNQHKLYDRQNAKSRAKWLSAIARNICMRWTRTFSRDFANLLPFKHNDGEGELTLEDLPASNDDVTIELEREELAEILDRALALLPPITRDVLIARYIHESPHTEIAERLGLSEDALVQRLYRGKLALRRVMTTHLSEEAEAYGIATQLDDEKQQQATRIWCPMCSNGRLLKYYDAPNNRTGFTCPKCWHIAASLLNAPQWDNIQSPKSLLMRQISWLGAYYWEAITTGQVACPDCRHRAYATIYAPQDILPGYDCSPLSAYHKVGIRCSACAYEELNPLPHLTLDLPETRQFWRKHPRIQWRPGPEIEHDGQPAIVCSFHSVTDTAHLDVIYRYDTLNVLGIHGSVR